MTILLAQSRFLPAHPLNIETGEIERKQSGSKPRPASQDESDRNQSTTKIQGIPRARVQAGVRERFALAQVPGGGRANQQSRHCKSSADEDREERGTSQPEAECRGGIPEGRPPARPSRSRSFHAFHFACIPNRGQLAHLKVRRSIHDRTCERAPPDRAWHDP